MRTFSRRVPATGRVLALALLALVGTCVASAQDDGARGQKPETDEAIIAKADEDLRLWKEGRREVGIMYRVDRRLKEFLRQRPDSPLRAQAEERLAAAAEILGEHNLTVALHYLRRYERGVASNAKGAEARLRQILCEYPTFSRADEALSELLRIYFLTGESEKAEYVQRLMTAPRDERNKEACEGFRASNAGR